MAKIVQFVSRPQAAAQKNLNAFVRLAQDKLTAFANGGAWDELTWSNDRVTAVFCKHRGRNEATRPPVPLAEPLLTFAKAYFRYRQSHKPTTSVQRMLAAMRVVELALIRVTGGADIQNLSVPVLDVSARYCADFQSSRGSQYQVGLQLEALADFCREHRLVVALPSWKSPFRRPPALTETLTEAGAQHRESKLPTNHSMLALADLFAQADDVGNQYFTSIMVLMMVAPNRISEVLALPLGCIGWEEDSLGKKQMYLRWRALKGGGAMKKWVPAVMQNVVEEAVSRLTKIGALAREAAKFAYDNPGRFMRNPGCATPEGFGEDDELEPPQVAAAVGVKWHGGHSWSGLPPMWKKLSSNGPVSYRALAAKTANLYEGNYWPHINARKDVLAWEALCLYREFECHNTFPARPFSWKLSDANQVNVRLGSRKQSSLFERAGIRNPDGSPIQVTTHQLRHWLSTMSARAGMDDYTLAQWAGRTRIEDNRHYDHRTQQERSDELQSLIRNEQPTVLKKFTGGQPVTYKELGVDRPGTAIATLYGMCVHDYAMTPCLKQRDCITCKEQVCIKGDHVTLDRIKRLEEMTADQLEKAREKDGGGTFGANRWMDNQIWRLATVRTMRTLLESESMPDGAVLRISAEYDPSPVRRALMDLKLVDEPVAADAPQARVIPAIEGPKDA